ncbi:hypothetical protein BU23DRAFT_548326 [Bimuria novae-zelandiae CBS 107.79]|uniref:DUF967 domain protein n=1 Tax=Bimuria novae-zelandiae CBS 107.79 TaxID=1447943 RepID=A0A6A5VR12_9PLEO|nr:hypothetical protein BU23DRAFT_548326 [Bimuria novae-zelandiae CBS 107.79]
MTSSTSHEFKAPGGAPRDVDSILAQERASTLPFFNAALAYRLGTALHARLLPSPSPACIHISTVTSPPHVLFHAVTRDGTALDNDFWIQRKRNSVIRFGASTWRLHIKHDGGEEAFAKKVGGETRAGEYAIHGGGVPLFVRGVEWPVGVVVVSGLKQWDDHMVVVEELAELRRALEEEGGNERKED